MHDMNFFAGYKRGNSSSKGFFALILVFVLVLLLVNGALFGVAYVLFRDVDQDIAEMKAYISNPDTISQIEKVNQVKQEVDLSAKYIDVLSVISGKFDQINIINVEMIDHIRMLIPDTTKIDSSSYVGPALTLTCITNLDTDPLDIYHAFLQDGRFSSVQLGTVRRLIIYAEPELPGDPVIPTEPTTPTIQEVLYEFSITATMVNGGEQK